jgi:hypothetical protein
MSSTRIGYTVFDATIIYFASGSVIYYLDTRVKERNLDNQKFTIEKNAELYRQAIAVLGSRYRSIT